MLPPGIYLEGADGGSFVRGEVYTRSVWCPHLQTCQAHRVWGISLGSDSWALKTHTQQGPGSGPPDQGEVSQTQVLSPAMLLGRGSRRASR